MNASGFSFQSSGNPSRLVNTVVMPVALNSCDRVLGVLVEVGVEDALVLEVQSRADVEEHPAQVVQAQRRERLRTRRDGLLDGFAVGTNRLLAPLLHLRDDRETVASGRPRVDGSVPTAFHLRNSPPAGWPSPPVSSSHDQLSPWRPLFSNLMQRTVHRGCHRSWPFGSGKRRRTCPHREKDAPSS